MELHLMLHNVGFIFFSVISFITGVFVLMNSPKSTVNIMISLSAFMLALFTLSHVIGVNITDPKLSRDILLFNATIPFIGIFNAHGIYAAYSKGKRLSKYISFMYIISTIYIIVIAIFPDLFLLPSVPKMYFSNYYNPGPLNFVRMILLYGFAVPYILIRISNQYKITIDEKDRKKEIFFLFSVILGYSIGIIPNFLVANISIDPLWGMFAAIFAIPLIYGAVRYELFDIKIIARQAFFYSIAIVLVGGIIATLDYFNRAISAANSSFPFWVSPLLSAAFVVTMAIIVWRKLREQDTLKYEFVTTVTHKFRTPLTHIKWASENLSKTLISENDRENLKHIETANQKLVELTDVLMNVSESDDSVYDYNFERIDINALTKDVLESFKRQLGPQNINIEVFVGTDLFAMADASRIKTVMQTLLENAAHYGPGSMITVLASRVDDSIVWSVKDHGIGIAREDMPYIFTRFYRGKDARLSDTEGMGIGLFIAKQIITRHHSRIWAESEGVGMGSIFSFSLPRMM